MTMNYSGEKQQNEFGKQFLLVGEDSIFKDYFMISSGLQQTDQNRISEKPAETSDQEVAC